MINVEPKTTELRKLTMDERLERSEYENDLRYRELRVMLNTCIQSLKRIEQAMNIQDDLK